MSDDREKIVERIRKLLALAGNNPSEAERDAAMAKAQQLLIDYNISMKEVDHTDDSDVRIAEWTQVTRSGQWARRIAMSVGRLYFCGYIYSVAGKKTLHHFVGTETNGRIAAEVAHYVIEAVYRQGAIEMRRAGAGNAYWTSFVNAASHRIRDRVIALIAEAGQNGAPTSDTRALVVRDLYRDAQEAARRYIEGMSDVKSGKARPEQFKSVEGWIAGKAFADRVPLHQQVGSGYKDRTRGRIK